MLESIMRLLMLESIMQHLMLSCFKSVKLLFFETNYAEAWLPLQLPLIIADAFLKVG